MGYQITVIGSAFDENHVRKITNTADQCGCQVSFYHDYKSAAEALRKTEILFAPSNAESPAAAKAAENLKWFASYFAGVDPLMAPGALREEVLLTNGSGAYGITIAEHMIMVTLMLLRRYPEYYDIVQRKEFRSDLMIGSLYDANVLVIGTGDIGSTFAKRLRGFQPREIIGVNRSGREVAAFDRTVPLSKLDDYLAHADIVALALPGTPETNGLMSRERIAMMKKHAFLVNVGRGNCLDQGALVEALNNGALAGAALDVFETEPIPKNDPVWTARNLLITPHCSGKMTMAYTRNTLVDAFCENLKRYVRGEPLNNLVNRQSGY